MVQEKESRHEGTGNSDVLCVQKKKDMKELVEIKLIFKRDERIRCFVYLIVDRIEKNWKTKEKTESKFVDKNYIRKKTVWDHDQLTYNLDDLTKYFEDNKLEKKSCRNFGIEILFFLN